MLNETAQLRFETVESGHAVERFVVAEERHDGVWLESRQPLVWGLECAISGVTGAPGVFRFGERWVVFFRPGECPRRWSPRVRAEARSIALITHVADEYLIAGMAALDLRFEEAKVHHPRTQAIPKQDEPGVFFEFQRFRCRAREECKGKTRERREKEKKCLAGGFHVVDWSGDRRMSDIHAFEHRDFGFSWRPRRGRLRLRPRRHRWFVFAHCWR